MLYGLIHLWSCVTRVAGVRLQHFTDGGGGGGVQNKIATKNTSKYILLNDAKFIMLKNSMKKSFIIWLILWSFISAHKHRFVKLIFIDSYTVTKRS